MTHFYPHHSRRKFLQLAGYPALAIPLRGQRILGANNRVRLALIGCGDRGTKLTRRFQNIPDVEIAILCDPDPAQIDAMLARLLEREMDYTGTEMVQDYRKVLERKDIDGVIIASPNHWHTLQAIEAMQAGKAVYVEKPMTHTLWEGRQLIAASRQYNQVIGGGFQNRSDPGPIEGIRYVQEGNLGKILSVHACCFRNRKSIGERLEQPLVPPSTVDYNLWLGPSEDLPIYRPRFHYDWHWIWNTGNGDMGNQAPHEIDMACWVLGDGSLPEKVNVFGGRFAWQDAGETPNMMTCWFEKAGIPFFIEVNDLCLTPERNVAGLRNKVRVGLVVKCEGGDLRGGRGGMYVATDDEAAPVLKFPGDGGAKHQKNFIEALRSGSTANLRSQIEAAERSCAIAHLANASLRAGSVQDESCVREKVGSCATLNTILDEQAVQLKAWGIDQPQYLLGRELEVDTTASKIKTEGMEAFDTASGRAEFRVPELI